jgi:hypothetical protein
MGEQRRGAAGQPSAGAPVTALNGTLTTPMTAVDGMKQLAKPWYSDQILPFDITLAGASELGDRHRDEDLRRRDPERRLRRVDRRCCH